MAALQEQNNTFVPVPYVGLSNLGRTGALNASLQLLFHCQDFVVTMRQYQIHECSGEMCLWCCLRQLLNEMVTTIAGEVLKVDKDLHDDFFMGHCGDSYGYLIRILCRLSHECSGVLDNNYDTAPFIQMFDTGLRSHQTCIACGYSEVITTTKISVDVPVTNENTVTVATLSHLLHNKTEEIYCVKCISFTQHMVVKTLEKNPKLLCIKLLRFADEGIRDMTPVALSHNIILPSGAKYNFLGCALHFGNTLLTGQSMSLLKCSNGSFKLISDSQVKSVSHESVFASDAIKQASYLVFFERCTSETQVQQLNISHVSLNMSTMEEQVSLASVGNTSQNTAMASPNISRQGSWLVSPQINRTTQSSPKNALGAVRRALSFSVETSPSKNTSHKILSPVMEENSASRHINTEDNNQDVNESFLIDNYLQLDDSITSYVSTISPVPQVPATTKRCRTLKPRTLNMDINFNQSEDSLGHTAKSGPKIHDLSRSLTMTVAGTAAPLPTKTKKYILNAKLRERRLGRLGLPPTLRVIRAVVRYETCFNMPQKKFRFFTGLTQYHFNVLFDLIGGEEGIQKMKYDYHQNTPKRTLPHRNFSSRNRLFLMLVRMRRGVPIVDLAYIFNISVSHCGAICYAMIRMTYEYLSLLQPHMFISAKQQKKKMPAPFRKFKNLRVIIDCAEFFIEKPSDFQQQGNTYSHYKHINTEKYLIGISCYGSIIYCSDGFEGNKSDKEILKESGMMNYLDKGDSVMADRGFNVKSELAAIGVNLIKPAEFKKSRQFLKPQDEILTKETATARIYVEHAIKSIKDFRIVRNIVPMSMHDILPDMVFVAAYLSNYNKPYIKLGSGKAK